MSQPVRSYVQLLITDRFAFALDGYSIGSSERLSFKPLVCALLGIELGPGLVPFAKLLKFDTGGQIDFRQRLVHPGGNARKRSFNVPQEPPHGAFFILPGVVGYSKPEIFASGG